MYFHKSPGWLKTLYPGLIWEMIPPDDKSLYLTFDDGPVSEITKFVLDTLEAYDAKATFFCVGENMLKNPAIVEKIVAAGHSLGNHTQRHLNGWKTGIEDYIKDIESCDLIIDQITGSENKKLYRPPYGRIKKSQIKALNKDRKIIMWDVLSGDFDQKLKQEYCLEKSIKYSESGSIVVFHDSFKAEKNLRYVLPLYIDYFSKKNFKFLAI
ncbi:MAG: polysaccharide deacetylase family protein [Bacteroidota bacterium]|jgi:peptidoglycan/xylan/chitin deacetylase (PgdA/CDA1 family)|nr:polysaccharide deacetylase family protein [Bacteroidota bacterium]